MGDYQITPTIEKLLHQITPMHQSIANRAADPFMARVEEQYKLLRNEWREEINQALFSKILPTYQDDQLRHLLEQLNSLSFSSIPKYAKNHNDSEIFVQALSNLCNRKVDVFAQFRSGEAMHADDHELGLILDMLVRSGVDKINVFAPYALYQREDKKDEGSVPIGAAVWFKKIEERCKGRLDRIITYDLHSAQAQAFVDRPVDHLSIVPYFAMYLFSGYFMSKFGDSEIFLYSPDAGGIKRVRKEAKLLGCKYGDIDKIRNGHGDSEAGEATNLDYKGKTIVLLDDMVDTSTTLCEGADKLYKGGAKHVIATAPHGVLSDKKSENRPLKALDKLHDSGVRLVISDSIPRDAEFYNHPAIEDVISLSYSMAESQLLRRLGFSVSSTLSGLHNDIKDHVNNCLLYDNFEKYLLPRNNQPQSS